MRKLLLVSVIVASVGIPAACSGGSDVRSDSGPSTTSAEKPADSDGSSDTTTTAKAADGPKNSPALFIQGTVTVPPGEDGKLSVVVTGPPSGDVGTTVPVIVRNNTGTAIDNIEVNGTARGADGTLAGSGSSQGFEPSVIAPGEWAMGYVYFDSQIAAGATFDMTVRGDEAGDAVVAKVQLNVDEFNVQPGDYGTNYVGIASNPGKATATDPVSIYVGCFDAASDLIEVYTGYGDGEAVGGGTVSFSVSAYQPPACASYAVGASGWEI